MTYPIHLGQGGPICPLTSGFPTHPYLGDFFEPDQDPYLSLPTSPRLSLTQVDFGLQLYSLSKSRKTIRTELAE